MLEALYVASVCAAWLGVAWYGGELWARYRAPEDRRGEGARLWAQAAFVVGALVWLLARAVEYLHG